MTNHGRAGDLEAQGISEQQSETSEGGAEGLKGGSGGGAEEQDGIGRGGGSGKLDGTNGIKGDLEMGGISDKVDLRVG